MDGAFSPIAAPRDALDEVERRYATAITPLMQSLIDPDDPNDPIALQFRPDARELITTPAERDDPIGDHAHAPVEGIVHRYRDRCLLKIVSVCPVYCRFCFRREMVGPKAGGGPKTAPLSAEAFDAALAYIAQHTEIWEVILTGGDPFLLSPRRARELTQRLAAVPHVKIVRWHTRVPIVDPDRVTLEFVDALCTDGMTAYVAIHANHPREITPQAKTALDRLAQAGIPLLSQTVLLKGVNDSAETLEAHMRALVEARVKPYYLHHPDLAPGTSHFRVPIERGREIAQELQARASGLCQPTYVLDIPGGHGKAPLGPCAIRAADEGVELRGADGAWRAYTGE
ncbi:MAG: lysine-2,3-aminomutase-like protein [Alphaproteobacteria bacterium]|nr:lysine-2,3-aminomutase-like protein [Alphaproteobacteria bacterium]